MGISGMPETSGSVYIFDFDLAKLYIDPVSETHIPFRTGLSLTGTPRYASSNIHMRHGKGLLRVLSKLYWKLICV